ncbi:hypothetical protein GB928_027275 [Shinella curvata]|uniref:HTH luxR-type domain-containing protein n=1 Tax=Shinella curvata TaxID=1817964 RepID=A0ABT8XME2_9HYPH|nr:hypothetical protein [Shinella curvata]MCJ8056773.1 hypothetical protein [Shinella curvata]MDO6124890.1 hypothetical protein [Shinella curvata]
MHAQDGQRSARFLKEAERLNTAFPILTAAIVCHWGSREKPDEERDGHALQDGLLTFGAQVLSPREAEVVRMILNGHSTRASWRYSEAQKER